MAIEEQVVVTATVKGKEELEDGYKLTLDIPVFKTKYPTQIWGVPPENAAKLKSGQPAVMTLERGAKAKDDYAGDAYWHYRWRWGSLGEAPGATEPRHNGGTSSDGREASIQRQVALKAATDITVAMLNKDDLKNGAEASTTLEIASAFDDWLKRAGTPQAAPEPVPAPKPTRSVPKAPPTAASSAPSTAELSRRWAGATAGWTGNERREYMQEHAGSDNWNDMSGAQKLSLIEKAESGAKQQEPAPEEAQAEDEAPF